MPIEATDKLNMDLLNSLPMPLSVRLAGGKSKWQVHDIDAQTALMRIDVSGLLEVRSFAEVMELQDADSNNHDPEQFWVN